ncbi:type II toxin-antitoxin system Phd/YefM family antitoxin [Kitasatospora sp. NPDC057965]|uniref:type II toxin-antitoxin system Phd/YefM family antitoxin n=1 Tax=Kitasatospora sp. NPDC057965 TaxID=3346291 RepID=UPI0036DC5A99
MIVRVGLPAGPVVESSSEVRGHLGRAVDRAGRGTGTVVTRHGRPEAVLVGIGEDRRLKRIEADALGPEAGSRGRRREAGGGGV